MTEAMVVGGGPRARRDHPRPPGRSVHLYEARETDNPPVRRRT
jgi:hypothetical protein